MTDGQRNRPRAKWVAGISLILAGIIGLAVWAIAAPNALAYYKTPSELSSADSTSGRNLRVGGRVVDGSLERDGTRVRFLITDGHRRVPVTFTGEVPDTLKNGTDAIAEGRLVDGTLRAHRIQAKCSSKFVPAEKQEHLGRT